MNGFKGIRLLAMLSIGGIASCNDRPVQLEPTSLSPAGRSGQAFRDKMLARWKASPSWSYVALDTLCRESFNGKPLHETNAMMRAAGQGFDLVKASQPAALTPPGATAYLGGFSLHSSLISGAGFNVIFYAVEAGPPDGLVVRDVACGVREVSL